MKKIYALSIYLLLAGITASAQNISVNTTGASNTTNSLFEVIQPAGAAASTTGIFARHLGTTSPAYAIWAEATGAANKYAIVVPITGGNVGIGITAPLGRLDVQGTTARTGTAPTTPSFYVTGTLNSGQTGPAAGNIEFRHDNQTQGVGFGYNTIYQTGSNANQELNLLSRGTSPITLNAYAYSTGNVGIGTTTPGNKLEVYGPASNYPARVGSPDGYLLFGPANTGWSHFVTDRARFYFNTGGTFDTGNIGSYDEDLSLQTQGTTRITVLNSNGNVGIGTATPGFKLHVPSGYIGTDYINTTDNSVASGITGVMIKAGDNYLRTGTSGGVKAFLNGNTNGWIENQYAGAQTANYWISGEARVGSWFRNSTSGTGLYNETNGRHFYSDGSAYWSLTTGNGMIFRDSYGGTVQGYVYNDGTNFGLLHRGGGWSFGASTGRAFVAQSLIVNGTGTPPYALEVIGDVRANGGWLRNNGQQGWYNDTYGSGLWMTDGSWIRSYGGAGLWFNSATIGTDGNFSCGYGGAAGPSGGAIIAGNVGIGTSSPTYKFDVTAAAAAPNTVARINNTSNGDALISSTAGAVMYAGFWANNTPTTSGSDFAITTSNAAIQGQIQGNAQYSVGLLGNDVASVIRCGGVLGCEAVGVWGMLGYAHSSGNLYSIWYVDGWWGTSGGWKTTGNNKPVQGIGMGGGGELMGQWTRGGLYGMNVKGSRYSMYVDGKTYTNDVIAQLTDNGAGAERTVSYVPTSTSVDVYAKGTAALSNGRAFVKFDRDYSKMISSETPVIVTVTPMGKSNGVYIESVSPEGFTVVENNSGTSSISFSWISAGTKRGYENVNNPAELLSPEYDANMNDVMFNENDKENSGKPIWWDGEKLRFDKIPEEIKPKKDVKPFSPITAAKSNSANFVSPLTPQPEGPNKPATKINLSTLPVVQPENIPIHPNK